MNEKVVAALDLGSSTVKFLIAEVSEGEPLVIGVGQAQSKGINKGVIVDLDKATNSIIKAKQQAENMCGKKVSSVAVTVSGTHIHSVNNKGTVIISREGREITTDDVRRAEESAKVIMLQPNQEIIHVLPRQFIIDGQGGIRNPVGMSGIKLEEEVHIVTGSATVLQNIRKCVRNAELSVERFVLQSVASSYAVLKEEEKDLGVALIDIGGGTVDIIAFAEGNIVFTEVFPIAGEYLTKDLAYGLKISLAEAERIKKEYGYIKEEDEGYREETDSFDDSDENEKISVFVLGENKSVKISRRKISRILQPRVDEIFENIRFELTKFGYKIPTVVVLTGGTANLKGLTGRVHNLLDTSVRVGYPGNEEGTVDMLKSPQYSAVVGLVNYVTKLDSLKRGASFNLRWLSWLKDILE